MQIANTRMITIVAWLDEVERSLKRKNLAASLHVKPTRSSGMRIKYCTLGPFERLRDNIVSEQFSKNTKYNTKTLISQMDG